MFEFQLAINESTFLNYLFLIISYAILGGGVKYIDDAFDEGTFSKNKALLLIPFLAVFGAWILTTSIASATILMAIVLGVLIKGKIDNIAFKIGFFVLIAILFFFGYLNFLWVLLIILTLSGIIDEIGNDYADRKNLYAKGDPLSKFFHLFFEYRFTMKVFVFSFAFLGFFGWQYFLAFLAFDLAYAGVMHYSNRLIRKGKFTYIERNHNGNGFLKGVTNAGRRAP